MDPWGGGNFGKNNHNDDFSKAMESLRKVGNKLFNKGGPTITALIFVLLSAWFLSGLYLVQPDEESVELVFGKYSSIGSPGLNYNLPYPIGQVEKIKVTTVHKEAIGYRSEVQSSKRRNSSSTLSSEKSEGVILTGDENILNVNFEVMWKVADPYKYLFNIREDFHGKTIRSAAESAAREIIGQNSIGFALSGSGRAEMSKDIVKLLQKNLDNYDMGVSVVSVQLKKIDPPEKVIAAFRDVQSARADREMEINKADAYRNDIIPRTRGEVQKIIRNAEAYRQEMVDKANGDASRFISLHNQYKNSSKTMAYRMYLETMEEILQSSQKLLLDNQDSLLNHMSVSDLFGNNNDK